MRSREEYLRLPMKERFIKLDEEQEARAEELHRNSLILDMHSCMLEDTLVQQDFLENVPRIQRSGIEGFVEEVIPPMEEFAPSMEILGKTRLKLEKHPAFMVAPSAPA